MDRSKWTRWGIGIAAVVALAAAQPVAAGGPRTRWVDDDGHAGAAGCGAGATALRKIQPAIDASSFGDTIVVCPGVYRQNLTIVGDTRDDLTIRAASIGTAFVRAPQTGGLAPLLGIDGVASTELRGLVLQAPTAAPCRRVSVLLRIEGSPDTRVNDVRFEPFGSNTIGPCGYVDGIQVLDEASTFLDRVTIRDFRVNGVFASDPDTSVVVEDSSIRFLHASEGPSVALGTDAIGLYARDGASGTFRRNTLRSATTAGPSGTPVLGSGVLAQASASAIVARNDLGYVLWAINSNGSGGSIHHNAVHHGRRSGDEVPIGLWFEGGGILDVHHNSAKGNSAGILVGGGAANHSIHENDFRGNHPHDCRDTTSGAGTAGTANFWTLNLGITSTPTGICSPP